MSYKSTQGYSSIVGYSSFSGYKSSVGFNPIAGLCNIYVFSDANPDKLTLGSAFTGNLKVQIASDSETGIHPDIVTGRQGAFVASTDVISDPQWVQYEISAVAIEWITNEVYNGRVAYAKDDTWYYLDMGKAQTLFNAVYNGDNVVYNTDNVIYKV